MSQAWLKVTYIFRLLIYLQSNEQNSRYSSHNKLESKPEMAKCVNVYNAFFKVRLKHVYQMKRASFYQYFNSQEI